MPRSSNFMSALKDQKGGWRTYLRGGPFCIASILIFGLCLWTILIAQHNKEKLFKSLRGNPSRSITCENQCRPLGSETLPKGIVANTSNLERRPLWGLPEVGMVRPEEAVFGNEALNEVRASCSSNPRRGRRRPCVACGCHSCGNLRSPRYEVGFEMDLRGGVKPLFLRRFWLRRQSDWICILASSLLRLIRMGSRILRYDCGFRSIHQANPLGNHWASRDIRLEFSTNDDGGH
ncbi:hypothetical protein STAS_01973 [Striga asiatica]|uniref:Uncharacterized protein n=1 Tax=Striga asiatica TaxID=4170 RepID=A0A5A7P171_STRAF|nr:hypothetical protein STAS_01973 [Striga asiatica]